MPKTNEKDAYFFSHDCNARNDPKILALRSVYGAEGYGVYFMLVEILREQPEYQPPPGGGAKTLEKSALQGRRRQRSIHK